MPFNGSGIYNLPVTTVTPAVSGTTIDDSEFNTFTADLKSALTNCIVKDGQTVSPTLTSPSIVSPTINGLSAVTGDMVFTSNVSMNTSAAARGVAYDTGSNLSYLNGGTTGLIKLEDLTNTRDVFEYDPVADTFTVRNLVSTNAALTTPALVNATGSLASPVINTGVSGTAGVKGIFILDNPETLYSSATYTSGAWTSSSGFASTTLSSAGATGAIIRLFVRLTWATDTDVFGVCGLRKAGELDTGVPTYINMQRANLNSNGVNQLSPSGEGTVALDGSSDFEFSFSWDTATGPTVSQNFTVTLIGYYV